MHNVAAPDGTCGCRVAVARVFRIVNRGQL